MRKVIVKFLLVISIIVFVFSLAWLDKIGLEGLIQYLAFLASGSYIVLFIYSNFWLD